ncbi:MAG TPA: 1,4-alpha-glucan branching protein domain-containing protein [Chthoniobacterales bacterium]
MSKGSLALILHAHLPFVRHPEHEDFLEEDWLYEAIAETYIPLLRMLRQLVAERVPTRLTFTMTPSLCEMLRDPLLQSRAERYLARGVALSEAEVVRTEADAAQNDLARFYLRRFSEALSFYTKDLNRDIVGAFAQLQKDGVVEIITCAATHGFLPLMEEYPEAMRAQVLIGRDSYVECFGRQPAGIWLPECAYVPAVGRILQEANIRWFVVDAHGLMFGQPKPRFAIYAPYFTPAGPAVFGRDRDSSRQVWSQREGYPGDSAYRDFYRDIGQDLPLDYLGKFMPTDHRRYTGVKYHRITGQGKEKELYNLGWAAAAADSHAGHFLDSRVKQIEHLSGVLPVEPIVMSPFDAELFGHWWFEGPEFLNLFLRKAAFDQSTFQLVSPSDYLRRHPTQQIVTPSASSWGNKGYWEVWLDQCNSWIYPHLHAAARRMSECARLFAVNPAPMVERILRQMARELLLAQSSDWAFLMKTGTAREYATQRTKEHLLRFTRLYEKLVAGEGDEEFVEFCESRDSLFADIQWRYYA